MEGRLHMRPRAEPRDCATAAHTVKSIGLAARLPSGWFAASSRKLRTLWIGNRRRCTTAKARGIALTIRLAFAHGISYLRDRPFAIPSDQATSNLLEGYGIYADVFTVTHRVYILDVRLGPGARTPSAIAAVESSLRSIRPLPR